MEGGFYKKQHQRSRTFDSIHAQSRQLSLHQQNFTLGFRHKPWASWHICTSGAWWTLLMWCLQQQANYAHHQHTWVAAKPVLQTWYNKQAENHRADDFIAEGSTDSSLFSPFDNTHERSTCSFRIVPWYRIIPYSCSGCADGTSGWCSSAPLDILSMPHNSGDFISTNGDLCRAAKALFPSPLLPKQMVSPRPCQTPHWTLFISKVLASWHRVQQGHIRWRTQSSRLPSVPRILNCFLILLRK